MTEVIAAELGDLRKENCAHTYYQDEIATEERVTAMLALAGDIRL